MPGRYHERLTMPDGTVAVADYRDPIISRFHAIHAARALGEPPEPGDLAAVIAWLNHHAEQSALCASGRCDHAA